MSRKFLSLNLGLLLVIFMVLIQIVCPIKHEDFNSTLWAIVALVSGYCGLNVIQKGTQK